MGSESWIWLTNYPFTSHFCHYWQNVNNVNIINVNIIDIDIVKDIDKNVNIINVFIIDDKQFP